MGIQLGQAACLLPLGTSWSRGWALGAEVSGVIPARGPLPSCSETLSPPHPAG